MNQIYNIWEYYTTQLYWTLNIDLYFISGSTKKILNVINYETFKENFHVNIYKTIRRDLESCIKKIK